MYQWRWRYGALALLCVWIVVTYYATSPLRCSTEMPEEVNNRLRDVTAQFDDLRDQYNQLLKLIKQSSGLDESDLKGLNEVFKVQAGPGPSEEYEVLRHRIYASGQEMWYFIENQLNKAIEKKSVEELESIRNQTRERSLSWLSDMSRLTSHDGHALWRRMEAANVSDLVQRRLHALQNPSDCEAAKKLVCNLNKGCGFGCQFHHVVYCLIFGYATERTVMLHSKGWRYNPGGWEKVFRPVSDSCTSTFDEPIHSSLGTSSKVVSLPFIDSLSKKPRFLPLAIPKDLAARIVRFNGDPASWWLGQMLKFLMKPHQTFYSNLNDTMAKIGFKSPIVGVHIRRTDKVGSEASFHSIPEYMKHVEAYYDRLELQRTVDQRRVYVATDDPTVLEQARLLYPKYTFMGDPTISKSAGVNQRYNPVSLRGLLLDLHLLAATDFLVCTFSSQVGRIAYEMMQANRVDATDAVVSLDDIFYYGGQNAHERVAVLPHRAANSQEMDLEIGDKLGIAGNHWDGFGLASNRRTNKVGLMPYYKTADHLVLYDFPVYSHVPLKKDQTS